MATLTAPPTESRVAMLPTTKTLINGRWVESISGKRFDTVNPATGDAILRYRRGRRGGCESGGEGRARRLPQQGSLAPHVGRRPRQTAEPAGRSDREARRRTGPSACFSIRSATGSRFGGQTWRQGALLWKAARAAFTARFTSAASASAIRGGRRRSRD